MANMFRISPIEMDLPTEVRHLRVAAYCRVSTEQEEHRVTRDVLSTVD